MDAKKGSINFFFAVIAIILAKAIYQQFDVQTMRFEKVWLSILYIVVFVASLFFLIKQYRGK
jgi:uncharacterized membrane protein